jgi:hypothetical protein
MRPLRAVVSDTAKAHVIERIKSAYKLNMHGAGKVRTLGGYCGLCTGDHASVLDGTAKQKLRDALPIEMPETILDESPPAGPPSSPGKRKAVQQSDDDARKFKQTKLAFGK